MSKRTWYEVRVREQLAPRQYVKKSKFYFVKSPQEAQRKYRGGGYVMWARKSGFEKALGIGGFFGLGDQLLKEFAQSEKEGGDAIQKMLKKDAETDDIETGDKK